MTNGKFIQVPGVRYQVSGICLVFFTFYFLLFTLVGNASALTLKESLDIALANNPVVVSALEKVHVAEAKRGEAFSNFLPHVSASGSAGKSFVEYSVITLPQQLGGGSFTAGPSEAANATSYQLTVNQTLFTGGKLLVGQSIANISYQIAWQDYLRSLSETVLNVVSSYYDYLKAKKSLEVINGSLDNLNRNLQQTQVFYDAGIGSNVDLLQVKTQVANIKIAELQAQNGLRLAKLVLETNLGQKLKQGDDPAETELTSDASVNLDQDTVLKTAYDNRPEWKQFELGLKAAESAVGLSFSNFLPNVAFQYSIGRTIAEYPINSASDSNLENWHALLVGSWNLFDGFNTPMQIKESYASLNAAKAQARQIKDAVALDVNSAYLNLASAVDKIAASQIAADLAEKTLQTAEINYRAQILSEQQYLDAHLANQAAQLALWSSKYDCEVAKAKLNKAVGKTII
jgi:outer membrane protein